MERPTQKKHFSLSKKSIALDELIENRSFLKHIHKDSRESSTERNSITKNHTPNTFSSAADIKQQERQLIANAQPLKITISQYLKQELKKIKDINHNSSGYVDFSSSPVEEDVPLQDKSITGKSKASIAMDMSLSPQRELGMVS